MSWAAVAKSATAPAAPVEAPAPSADERIAVVDTNAIISGLRLEQLADRFCTIPEVLAEVRDKQSRTFLSTLPFSLDVREPDEESIKAVQRFARETGDIHSLSAVDLKLLALAHTLEQAAHGSAHLREHPVQVRTRQRHRTRPRALPGWGTVANPEDWKAVDEAPEELLSNAPGGQSRIGGVQSLLGEQDEGAPQPQPPAVPALPLPQPLSQASSTATQQALESTSAPSPQAAERAQQEPSASGQDAAGPAQPAAASAAGAVAHEGSDGEGGEEDDEDGWSTACKSRNAARRKQRKERRRQAWQEAQQQGQGHGQQQAGQQGQQQGPVAPSTSGRQPEVAAAAPAAAEAGPGPASATSAAAAAAGGQEGDAQRRGSGAGGSGSGREEEGESEDGGEGEEEGSEGGEDEEQGEEVEGYELVTDDGEGQDGEEDGEGEEGDDGASEAPTTTAFTETATEAPTDAVTEGDLLLPNTTSNVFTITADFAMQNVMLQMGLRLVTRDGKQITRVSRWALRCSACYFVTKEAGRLFCPRCGNMTMDRVEVTVGPGGAEFFGVRKKFILRGTKYSLPKPKGGRRARFNPVLREDVLLARTGGRKGPGGGKAKPAGELDPFAPEFGSETWHSVTAAAGGRVQGAPGVRLTSWKNNPNEVKPQRKSRRK